jgi:cardiolipin synthase
VPLQRPPAAGGQGRRPLRRLLPGGQGVRLTAQGPDATPEEREDAGLWTVANGISLARLAAIPFFLWLLLGKDDVVAAAWLLGAIGATDYVDGILARALHQVSEIGKFLDPLADRAAIVAAVVGGLIAGVLPPAIGWPLVAREVVVAAGALFVVGRLDRNVEVRWLGKTATFIVYFAIPAFYLAAAGVVAGFFEPFGWITGVVGLILYYVVTWHYVGDVREAMAEAAGR